MAKRGRKKNSSALATTKGNPVLGRTNGLAGQTGTMQERMLQAALGRMEQSTDRRNRANIKSANNTMDYKGQKSTRRGAKSVRGNFGDMSNKEHAGRTNKRLRTIAANSSFELI